MELVGRADAEGELAERRAEHRAVEARDREDEEAGHPADRRDPRYRKISGNRDPTTDFRPERKSSKIYSRLDESYYKF